MRLKYDATYSDQEWSESELYLIPWAFWHNDEAFVGAFQVFCPSILLPASKRYVGVSTREKFCSLSENFVSE